MNAKYIFIVFLFRNKSVRSQKFRAKHFVAFISGLDPQQMYTNFNKNFILNPLKRTSIYSTP